MTLSAVVWSIAPTEVNATNDISWARFHLLRTACFFCKNALAPISQVALGQGLTSALTGVNPEPHKREIPAPGNITLWVSGAHTSLWTLSLGRSLQHLGLQFGCSPLQVDRVTDMTGCLLGTSLSVLLRYFAWVVNFHDLFSCMLTESFVWPGMASLGCAVYH